MPRTGAHIDAMIGARFGNLVCIEILRTRREFTKALCLCDCGAKKKVWPGHLRSGATKSCGCEQMTAVKAGNLKHGHARSNRKSSEYRIWYSIKDRCLNARSTAFVDYGGRGITICDRWRDSFPAFLEDMGPRPRGMTIDREDNEKGYGPQNCRWATYTQQARNKRSNRIVSLFGEQISLAEAVARYGAKYNRTRDRLNRGWSLERALTQQVRKV